MSTRLQEIERAAAYYCDPEGVHELRALGVPEDWSDKGFTHSGYFDNAEDLATEALRLDQKGTKGLYITPNPVQPDLLARAKNRTVRSPKSTTTNDEILHRRWLPLDFDPERPAGIASTEDELRAARARAVEVANFLKGEGFPGGVFALSGNGAHLMYRINEPADDGGLVKRVLEGLAQRFPSGGVPVEIDTAVHNAARIWKLPGTTARKGDATEERPHRRAKILRVADPLDIVPTELLKKVAAERQDERRGQTRRNGVVPHTGTYGAAERMPIEKIREALSHVPPHPDYPDWIRIVAAVCDATGGDLQEAEALLCEWSPEETKGEYRRKLKSGFDGSITAATLVHEAKQHGYTPTSKYNGRARRKDKKRGALPKPRSTGAAREASSAVPVAGVLASDVERKRIRWIWPGRLARGEMTIVDGDPGVGKSTLLADVTARITTGRPMPGGNRPSPDGPAGVVLVTTEDSPSHTIRPRLDAAGADVSKVRIVASVPTRDEDGGWDGGDRVPKLPEDLDVLKATCRDVDADLLVIDPLLAHLSSEINTFKDGDVRSALAPVQAFAEEAGLSLVVVRHLTKGSAGSNPLYRGQASIGIIGAARLAMAFGKDPEVDGQLVLAPNKINLGKRPPSLALRLEDSPDVEEVARVKWLGTSDCSAQDLFSAGGHGGASSSPALSKAKDFLREHLASGPKPAAKMYDAAEEAGIAKDTLKRARSEIAMSERTGGVGSSGYWEWTLKEGEEPLSEAYTDNTTLRGKTGEKHPGNGVKSAFEANLPKDGTAGDATLSEPKNGTPRDDLAEGIVEGGKAIHLFTGKRVTVNGLRSRVAHITDDEGNRMTVGRGDLEPVDDEAPSTEAPF